MANEIRFYKTILNEWFAVEYRAETADRVYFSTDGRRFLRLDVGGYSSSNSVVTNFSVENPHQGFGWSGEFRYDGEVFVLRKDRSTECPIFRPAEKPEGYELVPLPHIVEIKGLYSLPDGRFLFWTGLKYDFSYSSIKFYFGQIDDLKEYAVISANDMKIVTTAGILSMYYRQFEGYGLNVLADKQFSMELDGEKIRLVHKE